MSTRILQAVATSMANFNAPTLLDEKDWTEAERMVKAGLLERHAIGWLKTYSYSLTDAGIQAYQEAFPPAPVPAPVKAWGDAPPKTLRGRIAFIKRQCMRPLEDAYWLEVEDEKGINESWTLSGKALDKKLEELGYDRFEGNDRISFGLERDGEGDAFPTCEITGDLLNGNCSSDPYALAYGLEGFSWRRGEGFQMEQRDWQEASAYIERLDTFDRQQAKLRRLIVDSCFLEPSSVNRTGLICPGGGCQNEYSELIAMFDFMKAGAP